MKKILIASVLSVASLVSTSAMASDLKQHMRGILAGLTSFNQATTSTDALVALTQLKNASNMARISLPSNGKANADIAAYQDLYNQMNTHIDKAMSLTQAGKLDEAKQAIKQVTEARDIGHKNYR